MQTRICTKHNASYLISSIFFILDELKIVTLLYCEIKIRQCLTNKICRSCLINFISYWKTRGRIKTSIEHLFIVVDTFINVQTSYEEWSAWGECTASCGMMGTQQRTRGCHHILVGILTFSHECPVAGKESLFCFGACTEPAATMTSTSLGKYYVHFPRFQLIGPICF